MIEMDEISAQCLSTPAVVNVINDKVDKLTNRTDRGMIRCQSADLLRAAVRLTGCTRLQYG